MSGFFLGRFVSPFFFTRRRGRRCFRLKQLRAELLPMVIISSEDELLPMVMISSGDELLPMVMISSEDELLPW